jgi:hypothetical protein
VIILQKYASRFVFFAVSFIFISACLQHAKNDNVKKILDSNKMRAILTDAFLAEGYLVEQATIQQKNTTASGGYMDSVVYPLIFKQHHVSATDFYSTFNYYQQNPEKFLPLLDSINASLNKIIPKDTTKLNSPQQNADIMPHAVDSQLSFKKLQEAQQEIFLNNHPELKEKLRKNKKNKLNE